jgi:hypothetical protein
VHDAWSEPSVHVEPCQILLHEMRQIAKKLTKWSLAIFSDAKIMLHVSLLVILHYDIAQ